MLLLLDTDLSKRWHLNAISIQQSINGEDQQFLWITTRDSMSDIQPLLGLKISYQYGDQKNIGYLWSIHTCSHLPDTWQQYRLCLVSWLTLLSLDYKNITPISNTVLKHIQSICDTHQFPRPIFLGKPLTQTWIAQYEENSAAHIKRLLQSQQCHFFFKGNQMHVFTQTQYLQSIKHVSVTEKKPRLEGLWHWQQQREIITASSNIATLHVGDIIHAEYPEHSSQNGKYIITKIHVHVDENQTLQTLHLKLSTAQPNYPKKYSALYMPGIHRATVIKRISGYRCGYDWEKNNLDFTPKAILSTHSKIYFQPTVGNIIYIKHSAGDITQPMLIGAVHPPNNIPPIQGYSSETGHYWQATHTQRYHSIGDFSLSAKSRLSVQAAKTLHATHDSLSLSAPSQQITYKARQRITLTAGKNHITLLPDKLIIHGIVVKLFTC